MFVCVSCNPITRRIMFDDYDNGESLVMFEIVDCHIIVLCVCGWVVD